MARKRLLTDDQLALAAAEIARGRSRAQVAETMGVSAQGLGQALKSRSKGSKVSPLKETEPEVETFGTEDPAEAEPSASELAAVGLSEEMSPEEQRRRVSERIRKTDAQIEALEVAGEYAEARKLQSSYSQMQSVLSRIKKAVDPDLVSIGRSEIKATRTALVKQCTDYVAARALRCPDCDRAFAIKWGVGE